MRRKRKLGRFAVPVKPTRGPLQEIATVRDAAKLILALNQPRQQQMSWISVAESLAKAVKTGRKANVELARVQLIEALNHEEWL
jgi:ABC-type uncharacterized transport system involved in gliding motility auxiliary subunit